MPPNNSLGIPAGPKDPLLMLTNEVDARMEAQRFGNSPYHRPASAEVMKAPQDEFIYRLSKPTTLEDKGLLVGVFTAAGAIVGAALSKAGKRAGGAKFGAVLAGLTGLLFANREGSFVQNTWQTIKGWFTQTNKHNSYYDMSRSDDQFPGF